MLRSSWRLTVSNDDAGGCLDSHDASSSSAQSQSSQRARRGVQCLRRSLSTSRAGFSWWEAWGPRLNAALSTSVSTSPRLVVAAVRRRSSSDASADQSRCCRADPVTDPPAALQHPQHACSEGHTRSYSSTDIHFITEIVRHEIGIGYCCMLGNSRSSSNSLIAQSVVFGPLNDNIVIDY